MSDIGQSGYIRNELMKLSQRLSAIAVQADNSDFANPVNALLEVAGQVDQSWSQSNLGYHANIYCKNFQPPPPGEYFNSEWGQGTTEVWYKYSPDKVIEYIKNQAGNPDLDKIQRDANDAICIFEDSKENVNSLLSVFFHNNNDGYIRKLLDDVAELEIPSHDQVLKRFFPPRQQGTRDSLALNQGFKHAPHQVFIAQVASLKRPFYAADELSKLCRNAARHIERFIKGLVSSDQSQQMRKHVFIGHGHSLLWCELKDFVDRLGLEWDEFNRISIAGVATTDRLGQMLDSAAIAFLVATAEDETSTGAHVARQNVVHEIGLFQGRLGFARAIVLLEDGCEEFSNIHGLGQIRFSKGNISACFEKVRKVLEREGLLVTGK